MSFKLIRFLLPLILFLSISVILWRGLSLDPSLIPSPLINQPAPTFSLPLLFDEKTKTTQNDFLGHITLVNTWASWCYACVAEHAFLSTLATERDLLLYGLNYKDKAADAKNWLKYYGNPYHIIAFDERGETGIDWGVYGTPETFLIDQQGNIRYKHIGPVTTEVWESSFKPLIKELRKNSL